MSDLSKKLYLFALRNVSLHDYFKISSKLSLIMFYESFWSIVSVSVQKWRIMIGYIAVTVRTNDLNQFHSVILCPCFTHTTNQLLKVFVVIVRWVYLVCLLLYDRKLIIDLRYCFPLLIVWSFGHDTFERCHFLTCFQGLWKLSAIVVNYLSNYCHLVCYFLRNSLP